MAYNDTPLATDQINHTQPTIRENFQTIQTAFNANHVALATPDGKHSKVDLPRIAVAPTAAGTDLTVYTFLNAMTTQSELYVARNGVASIPYTAAGKATAGWTYLPSGLLIKWGEILTSTVSTVTLNAVPGPNFSNTVFPFIAFATPKNTVYGPAAANLTGTMVAPTLEVRTLTAGILTAWLVIGI